MDFESEYPSAGQVEELFFADDYVGGADSPQEAVELRGEMIGVGFYYANGVQVIRLY